MRKEHGKIMEKSEKNNGRKDEGMSRRDFVGALGAGLGSACILGALDTSTVLAESETPQKAILFDSTQCIACHTCEEACKKANKFEGEVTEESVLSADTFLKVTMTEISRPGDEGVPTYIFNRFACRHCGSCANVCPAKALYREKTG
jgi:formate hydrogenlyase subunit 6/NADH:ubiquinone oxidoreductase subunit I